MDKDAALIYHVAIQKRVPITFFFSGVEIESMRHHPISEAIRNGPFINPRFGHCDSYSPEIGVMTYNHNPLYLPGFWDQREYLEGILPDQIGRSIDVAQQVLGITPVTFTGPDGIYAPAAAYKLRQHGLDSVVVSGEFLGDYRHGKGMVYHASGLRHPMRTNDIQPHHFHSPKDLVNRIMNYAYENNTPHVIVSCDIDEFNGMKARPLGEGIGFLCQLGDEIYRPETKMINCNASSYWNPHQDFNITRVWPWNEPHSMQNGRGDFDYMFHDRLNMLKHLVWLIGQRNREGWNVQPAKEDYYIAGDAACLHRAFGNGWIEQHFWKHVLKVKEFLRG